MIRSMTGFGRAEIANGNWNIKVETKSVNHRYLDIAIRLPKVYNCLEDPIRKRIQESFARGRVEIYLNIEELGEKERMVKIDKGLLQGYLTAVAEIKQELNITQQIALDHLFQLPDVFSVAEPAVDWDKLSCVVISCLQQAIEEMQRMREIEGEKLKEDIIAKVSNIEDIIEQIKSRAPQVVANYQTRLEQRLRELLDTSGIAEERIVTEVAIFAERCSIDEEIVRLHSHTQQFHHSLAQNVPVGRKLDFLLQEMNREINTIGSKANDSGISHFVVEVKSELEKIREQVQNIE